MARVEVSPIKEAEGTLVSVDPRVYVNGFPKSGTHMLEQMVATMTRPMAFRKVDGSFVGPWAGSFQDHSWTTEWIPEPQMFRRLGFLRDGTYMKGHLGYRKTVETFLWGIGAATIFLYRDLRDVAVSLTHHIVTRHGSHSHPEWYEALGFDGALSAVITGLEQYSGVVERWKQYAGWLDVGWVLPLRYEDVLADRKKASAKIVDYVIGHNAEFRGYKAIIDPEEFDRAVAVMAEASRDTAHSQTFRKGTPGEWRKTFKPKHVEEFKNTGGAEWLVTLGYEKNDAWTV